MLALLQRRSPGCLPIHNSARLITTQPQGLSPYVRQWDPSKTELFRWPGDTPPIAREDAKLKATRRARRKKIYEKAVVVVPRNRVSKSNHALQKLNDKLAQAGSGQQEHAGIALSLWQAYSIAKQIVPRLLFQMPERAFDILWATQATLDPDLRKSRFQKLCLDMRKVGRIETVFQRTKYLESMFFNGKKDEALRGWEEDHNALTVGHQRQGYKPEHLEAGAKLYSYARNPKRALEIMRELFESHPKWDTSIVLTVFRAHTCMKAFGPHYEAKLLYLDMKERVGKLASLSDYDPWFIGFLEARRVGYAKLVFSDMVKDGHLAAGYSPNEVTKVLERLDMFFRLGTDMEKVNKIAMHALSVLPEPYHPHVFGTWMKTAVIAKEPEAAVHVIEMMRSRGYQPETYHLNLLLRSLFQSKADPWILKAENIGWQMVDAARRSGGKEDEPKRVAAILERACQSAEAQLDRPATSLAKGDVSTFALLMAHHARDLQWEHVNWLARQLKELYPEPNTTVMNVLIDNHCRQGKYLAGWSLYKSLTHDPKDTAGLFPNGATIRSLWKTLRIALADPSLRHSPDLPTPRALLAETVTWWSRVAARPDAERFRIGLSGADHGALASLVLHCFSYARDLPGSLVALHVLRKKLDILPPENSAYILQRHTAWVDLEHEPEATRIEFAKKGAAAKNLQRMQRIWAILWQRRVQKSGLNTADEKEEKGKAEKESKMQLDESGVELGEARLNALSEFVRVVLKREVGGDAGEVERVIREAKQEAGVEELETGDVDAWGVV